MSALALFGLMSWTPAFLVRNFDLSTADVGFILGCILLVANVGGVLVSGWLTDMLDKRGYEDSSMRAGLIGAIGLVIPVTTFSLTSDINLAIALIAIALFFASFPLATSAAAMQLASPPEMRAQVSAIFLFANNLIGLAVGTTAIALITDYGFQNDKSVGYSVSIVCGAAAISACLLLRWGFKPFIAAVGERAAI